MVEEAQDVERDAVVLCQDGHPGGADLVGGVPVPGHPVAAHEAGVDLPSFITRLAMLSQMRVQSIPARWSS